MYYAHSAELLEDDLEEMDYALKTFRRLKIAVAKAKTFADMRRFDEIPKLHMLLHYVDLTRELGAPDGYNTELLEHLHIIYAKIPYCALNKVRPTDQMTKFILRQDALQIQKAYLHYVYGPPDEDANADDPNDDLDEVNEEKEDEIYECKEEDKIDEGELEAGIEGVEGKGNNVGPGPGWL
ncbi:hypothetical protein FRC07_001046 [Ceratobasidium sp. 392]|nr:hypothetical protein FRC07_001046 [Ceratobasidium sp. 392]